jgi:hypothetical protein
MISSFSASRKVVNIILSHRSSRCRNGDGRCGRIKGPAVTGEFTWMCAAEQVSALLRDIEFDQKPQFSLKFEMLEG